MRHFTTLTAFLASFLLVGTGVSLACGNSYRYEMKVETTNVVNAERLLDRGKYKRALTSAKLTYKHHGTSIMQFTSRSNGEQIRAARVIAIATVRLDGKVDLSKPSRRSAKGAKRAKPSKMIPTARVKRLQWAAGQLKVLHELRPADAELLARYAEAVTKLNTPQAADALAGLEKLAAKDMMPDAMGWVTLATLRSRAGNVAESKAALQACKKQARDDKMCVLTLAPGQG
jgi:hypothetical protein